MIPKSDRTLVIGNKPYEKMRIDDLLDFFKNNTRCNMALPNNNNGTVCDELAICNHMYDVMLPNKVSFTKFVSRYQHRCKMKYIEHFYNNFDKLNFNKIYYAKPRTKSYNKLLSSWGCPYRFSKQPRTGYVVILEKLAKGLFPTVFGFSINLEIRKSSYLKDNVVNKEDYNQGCHSKEDEIKIIRWLHENKIIDATLCMLKDGTGPVLECNNLKPSDSMIELLEKTYGRLQIQ